MSAYKTVRERELESILIVCFFLIVVTPISIVINTIITQLLWGWFITPGFGIAVPSFFILYGTLLTIRFALNYESSKSDDEKISKNVVADAIGKMIARWTIVLFFGFIAHLFV